MHAESLFSIAFIRRNTLIQATKLGLKSIERKLMRAYTVHNEQKTTSIKLKAITENTFHRVHNKATTMEIHLQNPVNL